MLLHPADQLNVWQLELEKCNKSLSSVDSGRLCDFVRRCLADPQSTHELDAWDGDVFKRAALLMLKSRGHAVTGLKALQAKRSMSSLLASLTAAAMLAATAARVALERNDDLPGEQPWLAMFGDDSTRDRPLMNAAKLESSSGNPPSVLLMGRPRTGLSKVRERWAKALGVTPRVARPVSLASLIATLLRLPAIARDGIRVSLDSSTIPNAIELSGIHYRVLFGHASARWQSQNSAPSFAIYSQSGLANTSLLERAQQERGTTTVHLVHGVSMGRNFMGFSDVAIWQCAHDARWHERIGGYRACVTAHMEPPGMISGGHGWLLLSNLVHPNNPDFQRRGIAAELELLQAVATSARVAQINAQDVTWKPHPSFAGQPEALQAAVVAKVREYGFSQWPKGATLDESRRFKVVISTRSTVLLDLLRIGKLGVLVDLASGLSDGTAVCQMPLVARTQAQLDTCISLLTRDEKGQGEAYLEAWRRIGPGRIDLSIQQLIALARDGISRSSL